MPEGTRIYTPYRAEHSKTSAGLSDTTIVSKVYKFMGCSVVSANLVMGYNGTASSLSVTLVEDKQNGDLFVEPAVPSLWSFSFPRGGLGMPVFYTGLSLDAQDFNNTNVPFYFCGICTNWTKDVINEGGRTITVTLTDPRELLTGVQCLLGGFALSQSVGVGAPRYSNVDNVIDVFGYYNYGLEANKNEYGIHWYNVLEVLQNVKVRLHDMYFEFYFTNETFNNVPDFYRIEDETIDLMALVQKVAQDSGSDFVVITRKVNANTAVVEFRGIRRTNMNPLTKTELANFVNTRRSIVQNARLGKEYRNEANSHVIVGGMKNTVYVAKPSEYIEEMHGINGGAWFEEDYNAFPDDIKIRLFGGTTTLNSDNVDGSPIEEIEKEYSIKSGSIFPFWGLTPDDAAHPLIEPFLPLEHLAFDKDSLKYAEITNRIPLCKLDVQNYTVRQVEHGDTFLTGDGESDARPFAYLSEYIVNQQERLDGYIRGLPLNTEVLRASLQSYESFWNIYKLYFPDVAEALGIPSTNFTALYNLVNQMVSKGQTPDIRKLYLPRLFDDKPALDALRDRFTQQADATLPKNSVEMVEALATIKALGSVLLHFRMMLHGLVKEYAQTYLGKRFLVCLPKSAIMQRIWQDLPVPTRPEKPQIEYTVDSVGYFENVPAELDGLTDENVMSPEEDSIRRRFMAEDGRFQPMAIMDWKPKGNINFNSNGYNRAMFQTIPASEFRPNRIAEGNPDKVFISCSITQLIKRPDLALVDLSAPVLFDPTYSGLLNQFDYAGMDDEELASKSQVIKYFWRFIKSDDKLRTAIKLCANGLNIPFNTYASQLVLEWSRILSDIDSDPFRRAESTEFIMDLNSICIPLTSTCVSYGPWYANYNDVVGTTSIEVDTSLVPWNFTTPQDVDPNATQDDGLTPMERLVNAGLERLDRTICNTEYIDSASVSVAGFPEYGQGSNLGYNNNLTTISVDFNTGGIITTYNFATYSSRPGNFRKSEYDNISRARVDTRQKLMDTRNMNIVHSTAPSWYGINQFKD